MIWLTRACQVGKDAERLANWSPHAQKRDRSEWTNYPGIFLLISQYECMPRCRENQSWMIPTAGFVAVATLQNKFLLSSKLSRNPGNLPKTYSYVSSTSGKYMAGFFVKRFGRWCGSTLFTGAYCWRSSHRIPVQKIVSLSTESNRNDSALVLDSNNGVCLHQSSS